MICLSGTELASKVKQECAEKAASFKKSFNRAPTLAVILVGDNPSSRSYVNGKRKACDLCGISHQDLFFPPELSQEELLKVIDDLNSDDGVDGILVQLPLPPQIEENTVIQRIDPEKDVDGFHPVNVGNLLIGNPCLKPCTPKGVLRILDYYEIPTGSREVCVVGRSNIVGKPVMAMLMQKDRNATVTVCHSRTPDLAMHTRKADILIAAIGKPRMITGDMVKEGAAVVDVGITRVEDPSARKGYHWEGDVDFDSVSKVCSAVTPVPGGVGPMTIAMLMENTVEAAFMRKGRNK